ncbi:unnamed protein product, partial [Brassica napus]
MPPSEGLAVSEQREEVPTNSQTSTTPVLNRSWEVAQEKCGENNVSGEEHVEKDAPAEAQRETSVNQNENRDEENELTVQGNEWKTVSPGKVCRSAEKRGRELEFGKVSLLSNSRFSVLSLEEEEEDGEITERLEVLEKKNSEEPEKAIEQITSMEEITAHESLINEELENSEDEADQRKEKERILVAPETEQEVEIVQSVFPAEDNEKTMEAPLTEGVSQTVVATGNKGRETILRPSLPRNSKDKHKVLSNS